MAGATTETYDLPSSILNGDRAMGGTEVIPNRTSNLNNKSNDLHLEDLTDNQLLHENFTEVVKNEREEIKQTSSGEPNIGQGKGGGSHDNELNTQGRSIVSVNKIAIREVTYNDHHSS